MHCSVPALSFDLCKTCVDAGWEGTGTNGQEHLTSHQLARTGHEKRNPQPLAHTGFACYICDARPIIGSRCFCVPCCTSWCLDCAPKASDIHHGQNHPVKQFDAPISLQQAVEFYLADTMAMADKNSDGVISRAEFKAWGATSRVLRHLREDLVTQNDDVVNGLSFEDASTMFWLRS